MGNGIQIWGEKAYREQGRDGLALYGSGLTKPPGHQALQKPRLGIVPFAHLREAAQRGWQVPSRHLDVVLLALEVRFLCGMEQFGAFVSRIPCYSA